jgi:hypothetical protein
MKSSRWLMSSRMVCCSALAMWPLWSQAQADSVSAGRLFKGNSKVVIVSNPAPPDRDKEPVSLTYLLSGVLMQSTTAPFDRTTSMFGPFKNVSQHVLTITLGHVGGSSHRHASVFVNGVQVGHAEGGHITFQVPQGATYGWQVKNEHAITVTVPTIMKSVLDTGLPTETNFRWPQRRGAYKGCMYMPTQEIGYFYEPSQMSDGSDVWGGPVSIPELGVAVYGPAPASVGQCLNDPPLIVPSDS